MTMKNGFSTINRLLGKQRESSNLSKSTTNLSVTKSTVNINDSSQLHQNRITPLPIATSNAPFEQTFRITVLLPRDQLYVARLGAKVRLHKLMQLVCENKQLDADKYEFQHPADPSQIFSCDLTIGAVGLSEIRLCTKSENNNTLRVEDVTSSSRHNSFSSSKFSRNSKNISNTPSLYSSINSLNSMSSSGIDTTYRNISPATTPTKPMAPIVPTRKKRLAPRPPSQILSVDSDAVSTKTFESATSNQSSSIIRTEFVSSSNNLDSRLEQTVLGTNNNNNNNDLSKSNISIDCNGNTKGSLQPIEHCIDEQCQERKVLLKSQSSLCISTNDDTSPNGIENNSSINQPEPSPRRKVQTLPKKSVPVAPPRSTKPLTELVNETQPENKVSTTLLITPVPLPRSASTENLISEPIVENSKNITKIHMNPSPTPESNSVLQTEEVKSTPIELVVEEVKEPILDGKDSWKSSTPSLESKHKSFIESSSEDDEMVKVYDLSLRKTIVKSLSNHKTTEVIEVVSTNKEESHQPSSLAEKVIVKSPDLVDSSEKEVLKVIPVEPEIKVELNTSVVEAQQPVISPVKENPESSVPTKTEEHQNNSLMKDEPSKHIEEQRITEEIKKEENIEVIKCEELSPKVAEIIEEIKEVKLESLPVKPDLPKPQEIPKTPVSEEPEQLITQPVVNLETPKPEVIDDTITITNGDTDETTLSNKQKPLLTTLERLGGDEELESIPDTAIQSTKHSLAARSSSFLSLTQFEFKNQRNQNTTDDYFSRRRSSSELSIGESPSLQSIGVMKSILNSRKSSLCGSDESKPPPIECDIHPMEEPSPKSSKNNIFKTNTTIKSSEEKIYRYSGPPTIQFSTWSERPKVQVSIKDEQDCNLEKIKSGQKSPPTSIAVSKPDLVVLQRNNNHQNMNSGRDLDLVRNTQKVTLRENSISSSYSKPQNPIPTYTIPKFILGSRTSWSVTTATAAASNGNSSLTQDNRPPINQKPLLRPISMTQLNSSSVIRQTPSPSSPPPPVFGQGTLRKTGFKEKIVPLQDTNDTDVSKPIAFTLKNNQTKPQITPKTFINSSSRTETPVSVAAVPQAPPPPPPIIRAVVTKQRSQMPALSVDPRDQLLSAIRNFKLDELKNSNIK